MIGLPISIDWKDKNYNLIIIIIDLSIKMIYFKLMKIMINIPSLTKEIINVVIKHYSLSNSIIADQDLLFILKF